MGLGYQLDICSVGMAVSSPSQRGLFSRPAVLYGVIIVLLFLCAVLLKISNERAKEVAELESTMIESQQTIDSTNKERDIALLERKETEAELEKLRKSKKGYIYNCFAIL